jgi:hypothetical protein
MRLPIVVALNFDPDASTPDRVRSMQAFHGAV